MSFKRIGNYMVVAFIGGLGLFNSSKLEIRQATDTNAELLFQNGQIISSAVIVICFAGMIAETLVMRARKSKSRLSNAFNHPDDELSATEFYEKHAEDAQEKPPKSKKKAKKKTEGKNDG
jgi:hypothetical protein